MSHCERGCCHPTRAQRWGRRRRRLLGLPLRFQIWLFEPPPRRSSHSTASAMLEVLLRVGTIALAFGAVFACSLLLAHIL